jgi:hypothetical protein
MKTALALIALAIGVASAPFATYADPTPSPAPTSTPTPTPAPSPAPTVTPYTVLKPTNVGPPPAPQDQLLRNAVILGGLRLQNGIGLLQRSTDETALFMSTFRSSEPTTDLAAFERIPAGSSIRTYQDHGNTMAVVLDTPKGIQTVVVHSRLSDMGTVWLVSPVPEHS